MFDILKENIVKGNCVSTPERTPYTYPSYQWRGFKKNFAPIYDFSCIVSTVTSTNLT